MSVFDGDDLLLAIQRRHNMVKVVDLQAVSESTRLCRVGSTASLTMSCMAQCIMNKPGGRKAGVNGSINLISNRKSFQQLSLTIEGSCLSCSLLLPISVLGLVDISRASNLKTGTPYDNIGRFLPIMTQESRWRNHGL